MYFHNANFNQRLTTTRQLWMIYAALTLVWTYLYGDIAHVQMIMQQPWVIQHHQLLRWLSDNVMYVLYAIFIVMLIFGYQRNHLTLRIIGWGYIIAQMIGSVAIVRILKMTLGHARPNQIANATNGTLDAWVGPTLSSGYHGFPSGHTSDYLVSCIFLSMCLPKAWMRVAVLILAFFNGFLRVALGKHFPLDVLGGVLIGGATAIAVWQYYVLPRIKALNSPSF